MMVLWLYSLWSDSDRLTDCERLLIMIGIGGHKSVNPLIKLTFSLTR